MRVVVVHRYTKFEVCRPCRSEDMAHDVPNLDPLGLRVLELFAMYAMDGQTDRRTDKSNAYCLLSYGRGIIKLPRQCLLVSVSVGPHPTI